MDHKELAKKLLKLNVSYVAWQPFNKKSLRTALNDKISHRIVAYLHHGKWVVTNDIKELKTQAFDVIKLLDDFNKGKQKSNK